MNHLDACRRPAGPLCSRCGRPHPPPPPPGPTPTIQEDRYGRQQEHHEDGSLHPMGTWRRMNDQARAGWCASWSAR